MDRLAHVLIIDDDEVSNFIVTQRLNDSIHIDRLEIRQDAKNAIDYLNNCQNDYPDLIILDINMPLMNGFEFLENYPESQHKTKFVILSSSDQEKDKSRAFKFKNVIAYVEKPLTEHNILNLRPKLNLQ